MNNQLLEIECVIVIHHKENSMYFCNHNIC